MADEELEIEESPGVFRIAIVGDSVTAGFDLVDREETYPTLMERWLSSDEGVRVQTLNFGVDGYALLQSLRTARVRVPRFAPDVLVVQMCLNDPYPSNTAYGLRPPVHSLRLWGFLRRRFDAQRFWSEFLVDSNYDAVGWANVRRAIDGFGVLAQGGLPTLLVLFPYLQAPAYESWNFGVFHEGYRQAAEAAGLPFLDLLPAFAEAGLLADAWPGLALHPDPEGQRLAALEIIRKLATLGYLPDGVDSPDSLEPD